MVVVGVPSPTRWNIRLHLYLHGAWHHEWIQEILSGWVDEQMGRVGLPSHCHKGNRANAFNSNTSVLVMVPLLTSYTCIFRQVIHSLWASVFLSNEDINICFINFREASNENKCFEN